MCLQVLFERFYKIWSPSRAATTQVLFPVISASAKTTARIFLGASLHRPSNHLKIIARKQQNQTWDLRHQWRQIADWQWPWFGWKTSMHSISGANCGVNCEQRRWAIFAERTQGAMKEKESFCRTAAFWLNVCGGKARQDNKRTRPHKYTGSFRRHTSRDYSQITTFGEVSFAVVESCNGAEDRYLFKSHQLNQTLNKKTDAEDFYCCTNYAKLRFRFS